jgi:hypothetical protein
VVEFGEWLCTRVLKLVPHRQWVFSIPERLRIYFLFNRKLLANSDPQKASSYLLFKASIYLSLHSELLLTKTYIFENDVLLLFSSQ